MDQNPRFHDHEQIEHTATTQYDDFSVWDIFRAQAPLMMILDPQLEASMMQSIITKGEQGGFLPIFPAWNSFTSEMVGDHSTVMMIDAWQKGIRGFVIRRAYPLMRKNALEMLATREKYRDGKGRRGLDSYISSTATFPSKIRSMMLFTKMNRYRAPLSTRMTMRCLPQLPKS